MTSDTLLVALGVVFGAVACGFVWGRLSARLPIPELLRMLATPLVTACLGLILGFPLSLVFFGTKIRNSPHDNVVSATAVTCFVAGLVLGFPAIFGWAFGYRKPPKK